MDFSNPTTNYGTSTALRADGSPNVHSYVRFTVSGLNGATITRARLLFYMNSGSSSTLNALAVTDNTWGETTINYNNAPAMGSTIAISGTLTSGTWVTLDVTSYVTAAGTYNFGVITPGSTAVSFAARELGAHAPQLIVDLAGTGTATPTAILSPTPTSSSTSTPTATRTSGPTPTFSPTPTAGSSATFTPQADLYVDSSNPTTNYGTSTALRADGSPDVHSYVRFTVSGLNGATITRARLLFYMNSSSGSTLNALAVADNTWGETTVNYNNAPAMGTTIAVSGTFNHGCVGHAGCEQLRYSRRHVQLRCDHPRLNGPKLCGAGIGRARAAIDPGPGRRSYSNLDADGNGSVHEYSDADRNSNRPADQHEHTHSYGDHRSFRDAHLYGNEPCYSDRYTDSEPVHNVPSGR